ncbi:hypothetical protein ALC62_09188 [Cyphomyrmex costatus]|uniref:Uncharacterized protein n=1 Tax=Cyphomyrmex costatus TaxID=456900 RepID=A0A151IFY3_9HYME|nr:hypothetical protein ALC62_09188 [Cyphomyrmex costatus]
MTTRSHSKAQADVATEKEKGEDRAVSLETREFELEKLEQAVRSREQRLKMHENTLREEMEKIEEARQKLEKDRDYFEREATKREIDLEGREQERELNLDNREAASQPPNLLNLTTESRYQRRSQGFEQSGDNSKIKISFREVTESIPYYDGYNIPLTRFTRACRRAREIIPPNAERDLTKLLINKLGNRAYSAVEDEPCDSISDLIDLLTGAFGSPKTVDQYRGELSTVFLKPFEHVLDYISRVKDLRTAILDMERREKHYLDPYFASQIDDLTARSFVDGLPLEYRIQIGPDTRMSHTQAFAAAKTIAKRRELDKQRESERRDTRYRPDERNARDTQYPTNVSYPRRYDTPSAYQRTTSDNYRVNNTTRQPVIRHSYSSPPTMRPRNNNNNNHDSYPNTRIEQRPVVTKTCNYCKRPGHTIDECRTREYNNKLRSHMPGNSPGPSGIRDAAPMATPKITRPMNQVSIEAQESNEIPNIE